ncbi:YdeI/OmpD-associated family protein [Chloroflexota bacterium]
MRHILTNKIRYEIPHDLKEALMKNSTAWNNLAGFANSYRNMYIGWIIVAQGKDDTKETDRRSNEAVDFKQKAWN